MLTVGEYLIGLALTELVHRAADNNLYFDYGKGKLVFVTTQDHDYKPLERYRWLFGGRIAPTAGGPGSWRGDVLTSEGRARGYYRWTIEGQEAYLLCKVLLPHLAKHARNKFSYCQQLMMEYMTRESNSDQHNESKAAQASRKRMGLQWPRRLRHL